MTTQTKTPDLRTINLEYALIQATYWISFCGIVTYAAVFLQTKGYSNTSLGRVMAFGFLLGFLLPQLVAAWIDRSSKVSVYHCQWILLGIQLVLILILSRVPGKSTMLSVLNAVLIGVEITRNPINTQISADMEQRLGHINYGAARGCGSIAFAPMTILVGRLLRERGVELLTGINLLCLALQALALLMLCSSLKGTVKAGSGIPASGSKSSSFLQFARNNKRFFALLGAVALLFFSHNLAGNYLINVVRNVGGDTGDMGLLNGFTALMEFPMMFLYDRVARRFRCASTVRFAAALFAVKALGIALAPNLPMLFAANALQLFSFALITPAMVQYVNLTIHPRDSAKGQALAFGMVTLGNILSTGAGGILFDAFSVRTALLIGAGAALLAALLCQAAVSSPSAVE